MSNGAEIAIATAGITHLFIKIFTTMKTDDKLITRVELAARLGVSPSTIYNYQRWNWIRFHRVGPRLVRYVESEVRKDLANQSTIAE